MNIYIISSKKKNPFKTGKNTQPQTSNIYGLPQAKQGHERAEPPPDKKIQKVQSKLETKLVLTDFAHLQLSE